MHKHIHTAKLTEKKVVEIRRRSQAGEKGSALARKFGVSAGAVSLLVRGETWGHLLDGPIKFLPARRSGTSSTENWRSVPGYEGLYSVSDLGNVRIDRDRRNIQSGMHLRQSRGRDSYRMVALADSSGTKQCHVARLVLLAFEGLPPEEGMQANHKNGDISDNRLENLEWVSPKENIQHSMHVLGHGRAGEKNPAAKLTEEDVRALRKRAAAGETYTSLGRAFDVTNVMARMIATGRAWTHVGGPLQGNRPVGRPPASRRREAGRRA